jgi:hypothetical protein
MTKIVKNIAMMVAVFTAAIFMACNPDVGGEVGGEPETPETPSTPETPETPEAPEIIENNGVGEDGKIALNSVAYACYLGNVWDNGVGDYYIMLSNDSLGMGANGFEVPMHQGGWILYLDLWAALSEKTNAAVLPEGTYLLGDSRGIGCLYNQYSLATNNLEQVLVDGQWLYRIKDIYFKEATAVVTHTTKGYRIETNVVTSTGDELSFFYEGAIVFEDQSDDEEWLPALEEDINLEPACGDIRFYESYPSANCDNYVISLFNVTDLTEDRMHPNVIGGIKLQLDIYPELGKGVTGTYHIGTLTDDKYLLKKEPWAYYPGCYWGTMALGTFVEFIDQDGTVLYSVVKGGTLTITENEDNTYTIVTDFTTEKGKKITCNWTGALAEYQL